MVTEIGTIASAVVRAAAVAVHGIVHRARRQVRADSRVEEDGAGASLPVIDQALSDFPDSLFDALGASLDLNNPLGRLGEHVLLRNHPYTGSILYMLDLQALSSDDRAHLVVGDEEANR